MVATVEADPERFQNPSGPRNDPALSEPVLRDLNPEHLLIGTAYPTTT